MFERACAWLTLQRNMKIVVFYRRALLLFGVNLATIGFSIAAWRKV